MIIAEDKVMDGSCFQEASGLVGKWHRHAESYSGYNGVFFTTEVFPRQVLGKWYQVGLARIPSAASFWKIFIRVYFSQTEDTPGSKISTDWENASPSALFFKIYFINLFLERGKGREKERERDIDAWEKHRLPANQAHAPTGKWTVDFLLCRMMPNNEPHWSGLPSGS